MVHQSSFPWGIVQGRIALPSTLLDAAASLAQAFYERQVKDEFCGELIDTVSTPTWMQAARSMLPVDALRILGFEAHPQPKGPDELVMTAGCDAHIDDMHGPVFFLVLFNDGLVFRQGRVRHATQAGEWFVFDDARSHGVSEGRDTTTYLGWAVPLRALRHGPNPARSWGPP